MPLVLNCNNCGGPLELSDEEVKEALETGSSITVAHDVCPNTEEGLTLLRKFKMTTAVYEFIDEPDEDADVEDEVDLRDDNGNPMVLLTTFGSDVVDAQNFEAALPGLLKGLQKSWEQVQSMAKVIDQP